MTVRGVPMTDYMENLIKMTMTSKAGQVIITYLLLVTVLSCNIYLQCLIFVACHLSAQNANQLCAVIELLN